MEKQVTEITFLKQVLFDIKLLLELEPEMYSDGRVLDMIADKLGEINFNDKYFSHKLIKSGDLSVDA